MNKKMQKGIVAAVAATMANGIVAPVFAASAETTDLASKYAKAYEATASAKTQKELTAARVLVDALYKEVKGTANEYLATTLSSILDKPQQKNLEALDLAIKAADAAPSQAKVNEARALLVDMPEVWAKAFSSYVDGIQDKVTAKVLDAIKVAQESGTQTDLNAAIALYNELLTITNNDGVKAWAEVALKAELDKVAVNPAVQSVKAINASTLEIAFNKTVDSDVATDATIYEIAKVGGSAVTVNVASVKADGKTVVLSMNAGGFEKAKDYSVLVKGMVFTSSEAEYNFANVFKSLDETAAPVIVSASSAAGSTGTTSVSVTFSESVDVAGLKAPVFKVNDAIVSATQSATDARKFTLALPSSIASGTQLNIKAENVYDLLGNKGTASYAVTVASDLAAPVVNSVEVNSDISLRVKFNEVIKAIKLTDAGNTTVTANGMVDARSTIYKADGVTPISSTDLVDEVVIQLQPGTIYTSTVKSRDLVVTFKNLEDKYGNIAAVDTVKSVSIVKDETKPAVVSLSHKKDATGATPISTFTLKLDEKVNSLPSVTLKMVDADGVLRNVPTTATAVDKNGNTVAGASEYVKLTVASLLGNGNYKVTVPSASFTDTANALNTNAAAVVSIVIEDGDAGSAAGAPVVSSAIYTAGTKSIAVTFDKAVNSSAINPSNYKLNSATLPAGTEITLNTAKTVATIILPTGFVTVDTTTPVLTVQNVQATDGGQLASVAKTVTGGTIAETVAPVLTKAEYTAAGTVKLYFAEHTGIAAGGTIKVLNGSTQVSTITTILQADSTDGTDDGLLTMVVSGVTGLDSLNQSALTISVDADAVLDTNGNKIAATTLTLVDKYTYQAGTLTVSQPAAGTNTFNVRMTAVSPAVAAVEAGSTAMIYMVKNGEAAITTSNYTNFAPASTQSAANLTAAGLNFSLARDSYGLALVDGSYDVYVVIKDASGNAVVVSSTAFTVDAQ